jgi:sugar phosphate isomerase/epimerase
MWFGVCAGVGDAVRLADLGYDYIELGTSGELAPHEGDDVWRDKRRALESLPLPPETFNLFVRGGLKVVGPEADAEGLRRYVERASERASQVGGRVIVFGSGGSRRVPDGFPRGRAEQQILDFLSYCADASDRTGVVVTVEPLNRAECNIVNTVAEGAHLVRRIGRPGVRNLADTYHMEKDGEPLDAILTDADVLAHVHTADTERRAPGTGAYDHVALFRTLRAVGYDARVSVECVWEDLAREAGGVLDHLRRAHRLAAAD